MTTPKDTRPFDLAAAKAGHPLVTRNGLEVKFIAHVPEASDSCRIVTMIQKSIYSFHENGSWRKSENCDSNDLFLAPLGYCEGLPVWLGDKLVNKHGGWVHEVTIKSSGFEDFSWPKPAHVIETRMKKVDLERLYYRQQGHSDLGFLAIANTAIARSIADGDVIPTSKVLELMCDAYNGHYTGRNESYKEWSIMVLNKYKAGLKK